MAIKFYNSEHTLVACDDDACVFWSDAAGAWKEGNAHLARECWLKEQPLSRSDAQKAFPKADLVNIPDMTAAKRKAVAGYQPIPADRMKELGVK